MDPSQPPIDGTCHFLRFPAELRNTIFEHTLLNSRGVLCREEPLNGPGVFRFYAVPVIQTKPSSSISEYAWYATQLADSLEGASEINQLKYVCRQLRNETKNILVCGNKLVFGYGPRDLVDFLKTLPVPLCSLLREITVWEHRDLPVENFFGDKSWSMVNRICTKHNAITIRMIWPSLVDERKFLRYEYVTISRVLAIAVRARKDTAFIDKISAHGNWRTILMHTALFYGRPSSKIEEVIRQDPKLSDSIRIFPSHEQFQEHHFRPFLVMHRIQGQELENCIAAMKEVFHSGI
jgi:hypothetical protein